MEIPEEDQIDEQTATQITEQSVQPISYPTAFYQVIRLTGPYVLGRGLGAVQVMGNAVILKELGPNAVAAGPLMSTFTYGVMGVLRMTIMATGNVTGNATGAGDKSAAGDVVRQSWFLSLVLGSAICVIFGTSGFIFEAIGISSDVSETAQRYFWSLMPGVIPYFLLTADQQFALGIKRAFVPLVTNSIYVALSMLIGYPLALGIPFLHIPRLGVVGLGVGMSVAAIVSEISLRLYYLVNKSFRPYQLFKVFNPNGNWHIHRLLRIGVLMSAQMLTEWGSLLGISLVLGKIGNDALKAEQVSFQPMAAFNVLQMGLVQGVSVVISQAIGKLHKDGNDEDPSVRKIIFQNGRRFGIVGLSIGTTAAALTGTAFIVFRQFIASMFMNIREPNNQEATRLAETILIINGIGLMFDAIRTLSTGALRGFDSVLVPTSLNIFFMIFLGFGTGTGLSLTLDKGPEWMFVARDAGIVSVAFLLVAGFVLTSYQFSLKNMAKSTINFLSPKSISEKYSLFGNKQKEKESYGTMNIQDEDLDVSNDFENLDF